MNEALPIFTPPDLRAALRRTLAKDSPGVRIPPPRWFYLGTGLGALLGWLRPLPLLGGAARLGLGAGLLLGGLALMLWAHRSMGRAQTAVAPWQPSTALLEHGPFRYSRNPMYLAAALMQAGAGLLLNSGWVLLALLPVLLILRTQVIAREEAYLRRRFGTAYAAYVQKVRRWL